MLVTNQITNERGYLLSGVFSSQISDEIRVVGLRIIMYHLRGLYLWHMCYKTGGKTKDSKWPIEVYVRKWFRYFYFMFGGGCWNVWFPITTSLFVDWVVTNYNYVRFIYSQLTLYYVIHFVEFRLYYGTNEDFNYYDL